MKITLVSLILLISGNAFAADFSEKLIEKNQHKNATDNKSSNICDEYLEYLKSHKDMDFCGNLVGNFKNIKQYQWNNLSDSEETDIKKEIINIKYGNPSPDKVEKLLVEDKKILLEHALSHFDYDNDGKVDDILRTNDKTPDLCQKFPKYLSPWGYRQIPSLPPKNITAIKSLGEGQPFAYKGENFLATIFYVNSNSSVINIEL